MTPGEEDAILARLVARRAGEETDHLALVFENGDHPEERVRNADLAVRGNQLAWELRRAGLRAGDRLGVLLRNPPEIVDATVGAPPLGLVTVPIDPRARGDRLRYFLTFAACSSLVVADSTLAGPAASGVIRDAGIPVYALSTTEGRSQGLDVDGWPSLDEVLEGPEREDAGQ